MQTVYTPGIFPRLFYLQPQTLETRSVGQEDDPVALKTGLLNSASSLIQTSDLVIWLLTTRPSGIFSYLNSEQAQ